MIKELDNHRARLIVNVGSGSNRRRYTKTVTYKGKKELRRMYTEFEAECRRNPLSDITVGELLNAYIDNSRTLGRKATTLHGYAVASERFSSLFKRTLAKNCTTYQIEKEIVSMSRKSLSAKSIKNSISLLSSAYEHAIYIGQLSTNPCKGASMPNDKPNEKRILHRDEIQDFLYMLADAPLDDKVAYELALFLGLRRSEILGLKENDVDIISGTISIHNTRHRVGSEDVEQDTKTKRSTRVLALPDILLVDIARLLQVHREFPHEKVDYLIQDGFGNAILPSTLSSRLSRLEKKHGLPQVSLHGLRHTYASLLNASGVDMARISAELGHSNLATTMNIYTHLFSEASESSRGIAQVINEFNAELP